MFRLNRESVQVFHFGELASKTVEFLHFDTVRHWQWCHKPAELSSFKPLLLETPSTFSGCGTSEREAVGVQSSSQWKNFCLAQELRPRCAVLPVTTFGCGDVKQMSSVCSFCLLPQLYKVSLPWLVTSYRSISRSFPWRDDEGLQFAARGWRPAVHNRWWFWQFPLVSSPSLSQCSAGGRQDVALAGLCSHGDGGGGRLARPERGRQAGRDAGAGNQSETK